MFFVRINRFLRAKVRFALFKVRIALVAFFVKSDGSECRLLQRAMKSDSLFCFGHRKGKSMVKRMNLKQVTL